MSQSLELPNEIKLPTIGSFEARWLGVRLFQLLGAKTHVYIKVGVTCVFGSVQNATFWKKLCFWVKAKNEQNYGALEVHKAKSLCALKLSIGMVNQLPNYPW